MGGVCGAVLGSCAVTAGVRFSREEPFVFGRSHCDGCGAVLNFSQTVPVWSYLHLRGRSACCRTPVDRLHFVGEVIGACGGLFIALALPAGQAALVGVLGLTLLTTAAVDARIRRLPDVLTLIIALLAFALSSIGPPERLWAGLGAGAAALLILELVRCAFLALRREPGLGFGDVKLIAALALWLGWATPWAVAFASLIGLATFLIQRPSDRRLAFGPAIATASWIIGLCQESGWWWTP